MAPDDRLLIEVVFRHGGRAACAEITLGTEPTGLYNPNHAYGTVDDAIGYVQKLVDAGADEIMFLIQMGTVPQWAALETIRKLGQEVIPRFRD